MRQLSDDKFSEARFRREMLELIDRNFMKLLSKLKK